MNVPPNSQLAKILQARAASRLNADKPHTSKPVPGVNAPTPKPPEIPERPMQLEPDEPPVFINPDPVFNTPDAATILGVEPSRLEKWRQRGQGPDYLQYEKHGSVRYELSALIAFKAAHRIRASRQPRGGRRR